MSLITLARELAMATKAYVALRDEKIAALERRIAALERHPIPKWHGTHDVGRSYPEGALVTRSGGLWLATSHTTETPGAGATWRLIVKNGSHREER